MKHSTAIKRITNALLLASTMILGGCSSIHANTGSRTESGFSSSSEPGAETASASSTASTPASTTLCTAEKSEQEANSGTEPSPANPSETDSETIPYTYVFTADDIPEWNGEPYTVINNNIPFFPDDYYVDYSFETYSELDELGRCHTAYTNIGTDLMPTEPRSSISEVTPTGWNQKTYSTDLISGGYIFNRSHLAAFQLTGEGANKNNIFTGTRYLNTAMIPFENMIADYIKEAGEDHHVLYRVTPIYYQNDLLARGVLLEARSTEDNGESILFNVFIHNIQPGVEIDYATGENWAETPEDELKDQTEQALTAANTEAKASTEAAAVPSAKAASTTTTAETAAESAATTTTGVTETQTEEVPAPKAPASSTTETQVIEADADTTTYILNTSTHKIHDPSCSYASNIIDANRQYSSSSIEELIDNGYEACCKCLNK